MSSALNFMLVLVWMWAYFGKKSKTIPPQISLGVPQWISVVNDLGFSSVYLSGSRWLVFFSLDHCERGKYLI